MYEIAVIIPCYNSAKTIERCLRSVINQSLDKSLYQIFVIDDGSDENLMELIMSYKEDFKFIRNSKNIGLPGSLNVGIKASKSKYIVRVDSDDYVHVDFLKILRLKHILSTNIAAVACDYFIVDEKEARIEEVAAKEHPIGCGIMFNREVFDEIGLYNESFRMAEDIEFMKRFSKKFKIDYTGLPLYRYTKHDNNMTNNSLLHNEFIGKI
jgi:glycosyltransferase involved in cell wall biosynthesis